MLRSVLLIGGLLITNSSIANECSLLERLTSSQRDVVSFSYHRGKADDLGLTLAAISLKESSAGINRINWSDPSFGAYHITMSTAKVLTKTDGDVQELALANQLVYDDILGSELAITTLKYWLKHHKNDWSKAVQSYNAGNKYWNGVDYLQKVRYYVRELKKCEGYL